METTITLAGGFAVGGISIFVLLMVVVFFDIIGLFDKRHYIHLTENERAILEEVLEIEVHHRELYLGDMSYSPPPLVDSLKDIKKVHERLVNLNPNPRQ